MDCKEDKGIKLCTQVNIPQVDNTALECPQLLSTNCILKPTSISYLGLEENTDLTAVIDTIVLSLQDARARIVLLEQQIQNI